MTPSNTISRGLILAAALSFALPAVADQHIEFLNSETAGTENLPFSEAVRVGGLLFLSGQVGVDTATDALVPGGTAAEARQTMDNIKRSLESHGYAMSDVVKCTVMLADIGEWQAFNEVYVTYFERPYPARSAFGANGLALGARLEVECIAAK
jgi:reactive intermediate/imine deaminase